MEASNISSAPSLDQRFTFKENLYPQVVLPEFNENNYRLNRIINNYNFLENESNIRKNLKKKI